MTHVVLPLRGGAAALENSHSSALKSRGLHMEMRRRLSSYRFRLLFRVSSSSDIPTLPCSDFLLPSLFSPSLFFWFLSSLPLTAVPKCQVHRGDPQNNENCVLLPRAVVDVICFCVFVWPSYGVCAVVLASFRASVSHRSVVAAELLRAPKRGAPTHLHMCY